MVRRPLYNKQEQKFYYNMVNNNDYITKKSAEGLALAKKYSLYNRNAKLISKNLVTRVQIKVGDITKNADLLACILKNIYDFTEEEITTFFNKNSFMLITIHEDFVRRLSLFNHYKLLEEVIFKGGAFLTTNFNISSLHKTKELYSILESSNISKIDELKEIIDKLPEEKIKALIKAYPLTNEKIREIEVEFNKYLKRQIFIKRLSNKKRLTQN